MKYFLTFMMSITFLFSNEELSLENDFLLSLNEVSEIATKTKLNIDDTPSFVTVLQNQKLQELGISTVFDALGLVPGVSLKRESSGVPVVVFRGVSQKSEVKLMIDGVSINNSYRGSIYHYLDFPIELIERIEVIRGSGSVLYGSGAISGVINIITKSANSSKSNIAFVSGGTHNSYRAGTFFSTKVGDVNVGVDAYYQNSDKEIQSTDQHLQDYSLGLNINQDKFGLIARLKKSDQGNAYGVLNVKDIYEDRYHNINDTVYIELSYKDDLNQKNKLEVSVGYSEYTQDIDTAHSALGDVYANFKENTYFAQVDLISKAFKDNELLIGMKIESSQVKESYADPISPVSNPNLSREIASLYAVNNFSLASSIDILAGLRYDDYSDYGDSLSPNLGAVYRLSKNIKLKASYSHAYRAPSWVELTSNSNLKAETSDSFEAGIIYKKNQKNTLRINFYTFDIDHMITKKPGEKYGQTAHNKFKGAELEYIFLANNNLEVNFFASHVHAKDENGKDLADIANTLASTTLIYKMDSGLSFGSYLKYVSSDSSSIIYDKTISYEFKDFTASLVIKDLFNEGTYYALPESENFDDGGRNFMFRTTWEF